MLPYESMYPYMHTPTVSNLFSALYFIHIVHRYLCMSSNLLSQHIHFVYNAHMYPGLAIQLVYVLYFYIFIYRFHVKVKNTAALSYYLLDDSSCFASNIYLQNLIYGYVDITLLPFTVPFSINY